MAQALSPFGEITSAAASLPGPSWLTADRKAAVERFGVAGLPSTKLEAWRTTPLPDLGTRPLISGRASVTDAAAALVAPFMSEGSVTLVFVDGFHAPTLSSPEATWPRGIRLRPMSRVLETRPDDLHGWFASDAFGAMHDLNTAAFSDGAFLVVEDGARVGIEVRVVVVSTSTQAPLAQHLRHLVQIGRGSSLRLMIAVIGGANALGFTNVHTALRMGEQSRLDLVRIQESPIGVPHFDALSATLGAGSTLNDTVLQTGPSWTRSEIDITLSGAHATADLGGVFVARGTQVSDIHTLLSHQAPGVISRQNYRGLAADEARGVFHGQIQVGAQARGTDATQSNKNMLLSKRAQVHSTPALEILTDDVKCKHGSATGQIDQAQLFYLRSRGIDLQDATRILTRSFAAEVVSRIGLGSTRDLVEAQIAPSLEALGVAA